MNCRFLLALVLYISQHGYPRRGIPFFDLLDRSETVADALLSLSSQYASVLGCERGLTSPLPNTVASVFSQHRLECLPILRCRILLPMVASQNLGKHQTKQFVQDMAARLTGCDFTHLPGVHERKEETKTLLWAAKFSPVSLLLRLFDPVFCGEFGLVMARSPHMCYTHLLGTRECARSASIFCIGRVFTHSLMLPEVFGESYTKFQFKIPSSTVWLRLQRVQWYLDVGTTRLRGWLPRPALDPGTCQGRTL